ncbi:SDR family NAD(P)-dependent oxidoreductase [Kaistia dalseonensis]|uniref:3-oxoacyl-[acyl-carrier protein] reductase n=1 Tax=Kaistia dalseonensis TaxID=410840 RepID=A0ABU0H8V6_9HYPH|nr:SDR family NAD(P)-dependent oxidoreductase [Kaistia dalseonensis]MCX5496147.1 SDR family NAD(P)-dependent oxidoreductase [Kaistia dalseonensis]MDQ0438756.1 3-oxoacyl-[acyl-carrier protein] reductase [Kaistia dalseonensis]
MDLSLKGKVAVITGPAKGMGAAISMAFAAEGCRVALLGRDLAAIAPVHDAIIAKGGQALVFACDVTNGQDCEEAIRQTLAHYDGRVDILLNVAGGTGPIGKSGAETTTEEFRDIIDVNMTGCFNMIRATAPVMIAQAYGKIVNVGGTFGMRGRAGRVAYSSSKWGLRGLTKSFALELGASNINVNCVAPGMVDGPRFREKVCRNMAERLGITEEEAALRHAEDYALKRISTDADVANACLFLASDAARQITGVDLPVDGGWAAL